MFLIYLYGTGTDEIFFISTQYFYLLLQLWKNRIRAALPRTASRASRLIVIACLTILDTTKFCRVLVRNENTRRRWSSWLMMASASAMQSQWYLVVSLYCFAVLPTILDTTINFVLAFEWGTKTQDDDEVRDWWWHRQCNGTVYHTVLPFCLLQSWTRLNFVAFEWGTKTRRWGSWWQRQCNDLLPIVVHCGSVILAARE